MSSQYTDIMTSLGIRVTPTTVYYAITKVEKGEVNLLICDKIIVPLALSVPEQLKYLRDTFLDIIYENDVKNACIRVIEKNAQSYDYNRYLSLRNNHLYIMK